MKKIGFCKQCLRNVPHILFFSWPVFRFLNRHLEFAESLPLGSWHCCGCERNAFRLLRPNPDVSTDVTSTTMDDIVPWSDRNDRSQRTGLLFHRKRKSKTAAAAATVNKAPSQPGFEHVGNVTRSDDSLLVRKSRAARYSEKFRDSVVDRVLSGNETISQIRNELGLSERDVLDWINDRVLRQQQRIGKLTQVVETVQQITSQPGSSSPSNLKKPLLRVHRGHQTSQPHVDLSGPLSGSQGSTIEGRVERG